MPTSKNKCDCCKRSSSSSSSSGGSSSGSSSSSRSKSDSSSGTSSSDSTSSSGSAGPLGRCCAIPTDYIVTSEIFPSNQFDEAEAWIRSQRNGREGVGFLFHGPIRLRFDGGWFVAVICVGKLQDDGTCECNDPEDPDSYTCEETYDPGYCYYLSGIPGLGVFTENSGCNCNDSDDENCNDCSGTFQQCEIGCTESGCGCCYEERPPATEDGVACSKRFMVLSYSEIQEQYPEIQQDTNCLQAGWNIGGVLERMFDDLVDLKNVKRTSIKVANIRDENNPCRIEVWAECECTPEASCEGPCEIECYDKDTVDVAVFDEWQADQIGMEWKSEGENGGCPNACLLCGNCYWKPNDPDWINRRVPCVYEEGGYGLAERDAGQLFYMTSGGQDPNAGLSQDCQFNQEWIDAGGYSQYGLWRWVREGQQFQKRDFGALDDACPGTGNDDVRGFERSRARLWVCENDPDDDDPEGGVIAKDITEEVVANLECLETMRVFCDGEKFSRFGNGCYSCDDDTEEQSYWTEKYGDFPDWPDWTEKCNNDPPLMKDVFQCNFNKEVNPLP